MENSNPYGTWPSPIDAETVATGERNFGGVALVDGTAYWLERRPAEGGRGVVMCADPDGSTREVTPEGVDVRTTVHEYGGGDFTIVDGTIVYSRFEDQRLYRIDASGGETADPIPLTPEPPKQRAHRYADIEPTPDGERLYCVRERHDTDGGPINELVSLPTDGGDPTVVSSGHDFYSFPRLSPDGTRLVWTTWDHPQMPWDGTTLHAAELTADGTLKRERILIGGADESVFQPTWGPGGSLYVVSDRTGWWNVYRITEPLANGAEAELLREDPAEYGTPQWTFGLATVAPLNDGRLAVIRNSDGYQTLGLLDPDSGEFDPGGLGYPAYPHPRLATDGEEVLAIAAGPATPPSVIRWTLGEGVQTLRQAFDLAINRDYISEPDHITYPTGSDGNEVAHALYYPPRNPDVTPPAGEAPPLLVKVHGGPTSQTLPVADPAVQYFTTRGIGIVDVNYRGSTGYGRSYRDRLDGEWGVVDTQDCVAAAEYLVETGAADPDRLAIRGGSAGGYAALCALAFHDTFTAGASYYGVADLRALAEHTHKFESRYLDSMVGPLPEAAETYEARSPAVHASDITAPLLVLQGGEDRVVPPEQAEQMIRALVENGTPYAYIEFPGERHGFRSASAREVALRSELGFYAAVFGFTPDDKAAMIELDRGTYRKRTIEGT